MPVRNTNNGRARHWAITINNYTQSDIDVLWAFGESCADPNSNARYLGFGYEVGDSGTPHLQVSLGFEVRKSFQQVQATFPRGHITMARLPYESYMYAIKGEREGTNAVEKYGTPPPNNQGSGSSKCWDELKEDIIGGARLNDVRMRYLPLYSRGSKAITELMLQVKPVPIPTIHVLRDWQSVLYTDLRTHQQRDRVVTFIYGPVGNDGKTWFTKYYRYLHPESTLILRPTKKHDMAYIYAQRDLQTEIRTVFIDVSRSCRAGIPYDFIEELKDGEITSGKYTSFVCSVPQSTNVVVMTNKLPYGNMLSGDRYDVRQLRGDGGFDRVPRVALPETTMDEN
jgi:hypothetical protein